MWYFKCKTQKKVQNVFGERLKWDRPEVVHSVLYGIWSTKVCLYHLKGITVTNYASVCVKMVLKVLNCETVHYTPMVFKELKIHLDVQCVFGSWWNLRDFHCMSVIYNIYAVLVSFYINMACLLDFLKNTDMTVD